MLLILLEVLLNSKSDIDYLPNTVWYDFWAAILRESMVEQSSVCTVNMCSMIKDSWHHVLDSSYILVGIDQQGISELLTE